MKLTKMNINELKARREELENIAASCAYQCDSIYNRIDELTKEIVHRKVFAMYPMAEKYIANYTNGTIEIFFGAAQSKKLLLTMFSRGL